MLRSCMTRSTVTSKPERHASLGLPAYVQFTSPIRRYADILAHFQVSLSASEPCPLAKWPLVPLIH